MVVSLLKHHCHYYYYSFLPLFSWFRLVSFFLTAMDFLHFYFLSAFAEAHRLFVGIMADIYINAATKKLSPNQNKWHVRVASFYTRLFSAVYVYLVTRRGLKRAHSHALHTMHSTQLIHTFMYIIPYTLLCVVAGESLFLFSFSLARILSQYF